MAFVGAIYRRYLQKRYRMTPAGAAVLKRMFVSDYRKHIKDFLKVVKIHHYGFSWDDWHTASLTPHTQAEYMKTIQYCSLHPLNGAYSHWIDDKLTLKYLCAGTPLDKYMPRYYFQIDENGKLLPLMDCPQDCRDGKQGLICLLQRVKALAFKRTAGSLGEGFYKVSYDGGRYLVNNRRIDQEELLKHIDELKDYIIIEYLRPHRDLVPYSADTVNCLRYLIARDNTGALYTITRFVRFGTKASGFVENYGAGGILCFVDEKGHFKEGNIFDFKNNKNVVVKHHPDTGALLSGTLPLWPEVESAVNLFASWFPQLKYMGIDFVMTEQSEVKILEVNSLTSFDTLQLEGSLLQRDQGTFFQLQFR